MFRANTEDNLNKAISDLKLPCVRATSPVRTFTRLQHLLSVKSDGSDKAQLIYLLTLIDEELATEIKKHSSLETVEQVKAVLQNRLHQLASLNSIHKTWKEYYENKKTAEKKSAGDDLVKMQMVADELGKQIKTLNSQFDTHPFEGAVFKVINNKLNKELKEFVEKIEKEYFQWCRDKQLKTNLVNHTMKKPPEHKRDYNFPAELPDLERKESTLSLDGPSPPKLQQLDGYDSDDYDDQQPDSPLPENGNDSSSEDDEVKSSPRRIIRTDGRQSSFKWKGLAIGVGVGLLLTLGIAAAWWLGLPALAGLTIGKLLLAGVHTVGTCAIGGYGAERILTDDIPRRPSAAAVVVSTPRTNVAAFEAGALVRTTRAPSPPASPSYRDLAASSAGGYDTSDEEDAEDKNDRDDEVRPKTKEVRMAQDRQMAEAVEPYAQFYASMYNLRLRSAAARSPDRHDSSVDEDDNTSDGLRRRPKTRKEARERMAPVSEMCERDQAAMARATQAQITAGATADFDRVVVPSTESVRAGRRHSH